MLLRNLQRFPVCRDCQRLTQHQLQLFCRARNFHISRRKLQDAFPNHYETLQLSNSATGAEIKKQFYALSKKYHPDVNHEPFASDKFVKISEAYHVLGSAEKKGKYDRDYQRAHHAPHTRTGSHSSHSARGPVGGRPASGLSKRRSQFRGPPPSFYAQGGYGTQGGRKQRAQAETDARHEASNHPGGLGSRPHFQGTGGFSPGDSESTFYPDPDLPYFDKASHRRTHDNLGARRERMGADGVPHADPAVRRGNMIANFLIVTAVVATATVAATVLTEIVRSVGNGRRRDAKENG
jgi:curved DNA-binding protein CbpA